MAATLPSKARVDVDAFEFSDGLFGLIQGVFAALKFQCAPRPAPATLDELLLMSGVAFAHYTEDFGRVPAPPGESGSADGTQAQFGPEISPLSEFICNWGPFESLSYYLGWNIVELFSLDSEGFWRLLQFEIASGRPVLLLGVDGLMRPAMVAGYQIDGGEKGQPIRGSLDVLRAGSGAFETVHLERLGDFEVEEPGLKNWLLMARPGDKSEWTPGPHRQRARVLRWAVAHARRPREFSQEYSRHFTTGFRAFDTFLAMIKPFSDASKSVDSAGADFVRWVRAHVTNLARARGAAARHLPVWAEEFGDVADTSPDAMPALLQGFGAAASAYQRVEAALCGWNGEDFSGLEDAVRKALQAEQEAIEALDDALALLPS